MVQAGLGDGGEAHAGGGGDGALVRVLQTVMRKKILKNVKFILIHYQDIYGLFGFRF